MRRKLKYAVLLLMCSSVVFAQWTTLAFNTGYQNHAISFINKDTGYVSNGIWQGPPPGINHTKLFKTTNGGNTWLPVVDDYTNTPICQVHFLTENLAIYRRWQDNVLKSRNACSTYSTILNIGGSYSGDRFQVFDSLNYIFSRNDNIYFTNNGGNSWASKNTSGFQSFSYIQSAFYNYKKGFVYGDIFVSTPTTHTEFKLFKTSDSCQSAQLSFYPQKDNAPYGGVKFIDSTSAILLYDNVVLKTTDFGTSWDTIYTFSGPETGLSMDIKKNLMVISGNYGSTLISQNAGNSFLVGSSPVGGILSICIADPDLGIVYGHSQNSIVKMNLLANGLKELNTGPFFSFYPNPTSDYLYIHPDLSRSKEFNIEIYNVTGALVKTLHYNNNNEKNIDVRNLTEGVYYMKLYNTTCSFMKKFIKQ